jgi:hypothetical protein
LPPARLYWHRESIYGFVGIRLEDYLPQARVISPKWNTLAIPTRAFRLLAEPLDELLLQAPRREPAGAMPFGAAGSD